MGVARLSKTAAGSPGGWGIPTRISPGAYWRLTVDVMFRVSQRLYLKGE